MAIPQFVRARLLVCLLASLGLLAVTPLAASAAVTGGCTVQGLGSKSGAIDLTTQAEWHVRPDEVLSGSGNAPSDQTSVQISAYALGVAIPIINASGKGRAGTGGPYAVADYSWMARTISVVGASDTCTGNVVVIIDDVNPVLTASGGGALALALLGLLMLLGTAFGSGGGGARIGGAIIGLVAGVGLGLGLQQMGTLDPRSLVGLAVPIGGLLLGTVAPGSFRRR
jgi:hypothetical protein